MFDKTSIKLFFSNEQWGTSINNSKGGEDIGDS